MSPDIHLCQSLFDLRTEPVQSASRQRHRKAVIAHRHHLIRNNATGAIGKTAASAGCFWALEQRLAGNTCSIERRTIPARAT
jgi:hypothetical protein